MGFFKKRFEKNVSRDNEFMKNYAIKTAGLLMYTENNGKISEELEKMKEDFQYTVASALPEAKRIEKKITTDFETLTATLQQNDWNENDVSMLIKGIRRYIVEIRALR